MRPRGSWSAFRRSTASRFDRPEEREVAAERRRRISRHLLEEDDVDVLAEGVEIPLKWLAVETTPHVSVQVLSPRTAPYEKEVRPPRGSTVEERAVESTPSVPAHVMELPENQVRASGRRALDAPRGLRLAKETQELAHRLVPQVVRAHRLVGHHLVVDAPALAP